MSRPVQFRHFSSAYVLECVTPSSAPSSTNLPPSDDDDWKSDEEEFQDIDDLVQAYGVGEWNSWLTFSERGPSAEPPVATILLRIYLWGRPVDIVTLPDYTRRSIGFGDFPADACRKIKDRLALRDMEDFNLSATYYAFGSAVYMYDASSDRVKQTNLSVLDVTIWAQSSTSAESANDVLRKLHRWSESPLLEWGTMLAPNEPSRVLDKYKHPGQFQVVYFKAPDASRPPARVALPNASNPFLMRTPQHARLAGKLTNGLTLTCPAHPDRPYYTMGRVYVWCQSDQSAASPVPAVDVERTHLKFKDHVMDSDAESVLDAGDFNFLRVSIGEPRTAIRHATGRLAWYRDVTFILYTDTVAKAVFVKTLFNNVFSRFREQSDEEQGRQAYRTHVQNIIDVPGDLIVTGISADRQDFVVGGPRLPVPTDPMSDYMLDAPYLGNGPFY